MAVTFPTLPFGTTTEIALVSSAIDHRPYLGGPTQRLARLGDRWRLKVECRKMFASQAGPVIAALTQGLSDKLIVAIPQPGIDTSVWSNGTVNGAVTGGRTIVHAGGGAAKQVGQFISIIVSGKRYVHQITAVAGATLTILPALKVPLAGGETIEFGTPKMEGFIEGNEQSWTIGLAENLGVSFEIKESR